MIESVASTTQVQSVKQTEDPIPAPPLAPTASTLSSLSTGCSSCILNYLLSITQRFIGIFASLFDLLWSIFCCTVEEEPDLLNDLEPFPSTPEPPPLLETAESSPVEEPPLTPYQKLQKPGHEEHLKIAFILGTLASERGDLIWKKEEQLKKYGREIEHIHPLRFLEYIFFTPKQRAFLIEMKSRWTPGIWKGFIGGLEDRLKLELKSGKLLELLDEFAASLKQHYKVNAKEIAVFFNEAKNEVDTEGFINYLILNKLN